jgi:putative flavoprotein involved in K+ transport
MPASVLQLAALDYRRAVDLPPGGVLVVGAGQTGGQLVEDLLAGGREVYWSVSAVPRLPRRYRGRDILAWLVDAGFFDVPVESVTDPAELRATMPIISGVGRYGHTLSLQWLAGKGANLIGRITDVHGVVLSLDDSVEACIRFADDRSREVCGKLDEGIKAGGIDLPPHEPDEADQPFTDFEHLRSAERLDLGRAGVSTIIWATGVSGDFSFLPAGATSDGVPRQTRGQGQIEGLEFIGLPWLTRRCSGIINGIVRDAELVTERVAGRVHSQGDPVVRSPIL